MITLEHFKVGNLDGCLTTENDEPLGIAAECYVRGWNKPNYPMPAIPLAVKYDYVGCVNIDNMTDPDDPTVVYLYDGWFKDNGEEASKGSTLD